jgi:hypothetical protein
MTTSAISAAAEPGFKPGQLVATPGALKALEEAEEPAMGMGLLQRHLDGDWGEVSEEDRKANDSALQNGGRLLSAYKTRNGVKLWVITEADRSVTTFLLPEEY